MYPKRVPLLLLSLLLFAVAPLAAQNGALDPVALARSAAPASISDSADVWVPSQDGYRKVVSGTNGWTCLVEKDHPESVAPLCYDPEGTRTIIPGVLKIRELEAAGLGYRAALDSVEALYRTGALTPPARPVISLMLSRHQVLYATPEGPRVGAWKPHVMIYQPGIRDADTALPENFGVVMISGVGHVFSYIVVPVEAWSDGS